MDDLIHFDGHRLWNGLDYHVEQSHQPFWKQCDQITPDSLLALRQHLITNAYDIHLSRFLWERMDDAERLSWLLKTVDITAEKVGKSRTYRLVVKGTIAGE